MHDLSACCTSQRSGAVSPAEVTWRKWSGSGVNTAGTQAGDTIAVVGLGAVGMNALFAAVAGGAERIIAIDNSAEARPRPTMRRD